MSRIKLDVTYGEQVVCQPEWRSIDHSYPSDALPPPATVLCYSFEEVFAEKIRAMGERSRPRDLYDIVTLFRGREAIPSPTFIRSVYETKCEAKGLRAFTIDDLRSSPLIVELESEWSNMLGHQLSDLPSFSEYWADLPLLFEWLHT